MSRRRAGRAAPPPDLRPGAAVGAALLAALVLGGAAAPSFGQAVQREVPESQRQIRLSFAPVVREVSPAVVSVTTRRARVDRNPFADDPFFQFFFRDLPEAGQGRRRVETSLGSGVILRPDGVVVTNNHVVGEADEIEVVLADRRSLPARLLSADPSSDLAFLKVEAEGVRLPTVPLGDSDAIAVGDLVLALGNPFGIGQTVTSGIVSAKERTAPTLDSDVSFIQTDAAINPGNSGGALVTLDGRMIGINTAIFTRSGGSIGIGFAVPSNLVQARLAALSGGAAQLKRPWLGAELRPVTADIAASLDLDRPRGVLVARVHPESAAARAGLEPGDVVVAADGVPVDDPSQLTYRLALRPLGERIALAALRRGRELELRPAIEAARIVPAPETTRLGGAHPLSGAEVANMSPGFNEQEGFDPFERGAVVLDVARRSNAAQLRLRRGDVIESVDGDEIGSVAALQRALRRGRGEWRIGVRRDGRSSVLTVSL